MVPCNAARTHPRPQHVLLYTNVWTEDIDNVFIDSLVDDALNVDEGARWNVSVSIQVAQIQVNTIFNTNFNYRQCLKAFRKLKRRFNVFQSLIDLSSVNYNEMTNVITVADHSVWDYVLSNDRMAEAYMIRGEPAWGSLLTLFHDDGQVPSPPHDLENIINVVGQAGNLPIPPNALLLPREVVQLPNDQMNANMFWAALEEDSDESLEDNGE